jgi:3-oxoadipate enol-lactonase
MISFHARLFKVTVLFVFLTACAAPRALFHPEELPSGLRWVKVHDIPIVYTDQGAGNPLLILSPYPMGTELWQEIAHRFSGYMRVIVVEPPGLRDPGAMRGNFSSEHLLHTYRGLVKALGIRKTYVLGVGETGGLAVAFGHHFPEYTAAVIDINGFEAITWSAETKEMLDLLYATSEEGITEEGIMKLLKAGSKRYRQQPPSHDKMTRIMEPINKIEHQEAARARKNDYIKDIKAGYITGMIDTIHYPLLMIRSEEDTLLLDQHVERARKRIPKARYRTVPDAGHYAFIDQPDQVAKLIEEFIKDFPIQR